MPRSSQSRSRSGMTLIELLVVIAIIAVLIALLVPAVQKVREAASRTQCANNLKNLGLALHQYHDENKQFPPGAVGPVNGAFIGLKQHSLGSYLLPYLEQGDVCRMYQLNCSWFDWPNQPAVNTPLSIWQCPSAEPNRFQDGALITVTPPPVILFAGQAACGDYAGMLQIDPGLAATGLVDAVPNPGGVFPVNGTTRLLDIRDGTSHTIMMAECAGRPRLWHRTTPVPNTWLSGGPWASRGLLWCRGATADGSAFYGPCAINCTNDREVYSFHTGGANTVFADASVHFLRADLSIRVFARLVTRAGDEVVSDSDF